MMSPFDDYGEYADIRRIDSRDAGGLSEILGTELFQFLATLEANCRALIVVKPLRYLDRFVGFGFLGGLTLLFDIRSIMTHNR